MPNKNSIIDSFYSAFQENNADAMNALYHADATFEDPAFGKLNALQVKAMWSMLIERGGKDLKIEFKIIHEDEQSGQAIWQAWYVFSKTKRPIHNVIRANFKFENGEIIDHQDQFDFWKWTRMALGAPGILMGWTPFLRNKVRNESLRLLSKYMKKNIIE